MRVGFWLTIVTILSLALLPGPAHALAHAPFAVGPVHLAGGHHHGMGESAALDHRKTCPGHHHGPACDAACCAPICSLYAPPALAATRVAHAQTAQWPTSDRPRPDADRSRSLRPPRLI